jgi:hypothetical protein
MTGHFRAPNRKPAVLRRSHPRERLFEFLRGHDRFLATCAMTVRTASQPNSLVSEKVRSDRPATPCSTIFAIVSSCSCWIPAST